MSASNSPFDALEFPLDYEFKAFGPNQDAFRENVVTAVSEVVPVSRHAVRERASSGSKYRCVSLLVRLENRPQLERIYLRLQQVEGLRYLL